MIAIAALVCLLCATTNAELFTAMADMDSLLYTEKYVVDAIDQYIEMEMKRLDRLKQFAREYQRKNQEALKYGLDYVANPVNAYLLIKRLTSDWGYVESMMRNNNADVFLQNVTNQRDNAMVKFPDQEDLNGAAVALMRLQDTYNLQTSEIAEGRLVGVQRTAPLEAHDCFELGRIAYNQGDYYHTLMWMEEALGRVHREDPPTASESEVLEYLAFSLYQQGNIKRALAMTKRLYQLDPEHPRAKGNVKYYEDLLIEEGGYKKKGDDGDLPPLVNTRKDDGGVEERDTYEALCRGEIPPTDTQRSKLTCYYKSNAPYLKLAPLKAEVLHLKPKVVLFRQILSDEEIDVVKELAAPRLARATVQNSETGNLEPATYRISKSAWLKDVDHPAIGRITKRADLLSDLEMSTAEDLQVANYGLGGHYDPHYDFARKEEKNAFKGLNTGNRIATILFYLSTPEAGGATVFPELKLTLFPTKNDAVFWHNLYKSSEGDMTTRHAACPVLAGIKWVSNKWIHEKGQEFRRPCGLDELEYE